MYYQQNVKLTRQEHGEIIIRESCVAMITRKLLRHISLSKNVSRTIKENAYVDILPERVNGFLRVKKVVPCWQLKLSFQIVILVTIVNAELLRTSKVLRFATLNMLMKYKNGILSAPLHQFSLLSSVEWRMVFSASCDLCLCDRLVTPSMCMERLTESTANIKHQTKIAMCHCLQHTWSNFRTDYPFY